MKKVLVICAALAAAPFAMADAGVNLVQKMYQEARYNAGIHVVAKYADGSLKKAIRNQPSGELCFGADPMWDNQDPDTNASVKVTSLGNGKVRASFAQYGRRQHVTYSLKCSGSSCKVANVGRLKQELQQCR